MSRRASAFLMGVVLCTSSFFPVFQAHAAAYKARKMVQTLYTMTMAPGETRTFKVGFKNEGTTTWKATGKNFVSLYTWEPKYRNSPFADSSWRAPRQPAALKTDTKPGQVGYIEFTLRAPQKTGIYSESFQLAVEDLLWIDGGKVTVGVTVQGTPVASAAPVSAPAVAAPVATAPVENGTGLKAMKLLQSAPFVTIARGGEDAQFKVLMKNVGDVSWTTAQLTAGAPGVAIASDAPSFWSNAWMTQSVASNVVQPVPAGQTTFFTFTLRGPQKRGSYTAAFHIQVDGKPVEGSLIEIPVTVTDDGPNANPTQLPNTPAPIAGLAPEPIIRVGTLTVDEETNWQVVLQNPSGFDVVDGVTNAILATIPASGSVTAGILNAAYWYDIGNGHLVSSNYLRFVPKEANSIFTITNFDRRVTRGSAYADNTFRNVLEIRYSPATQKTWMINELGMEWYLRGLAETSNISPLEFQKALITSARTYAYYHWERATKHASEFFHVDAYLDQVYKGYGQEQRTPNLTTSVIATRGRIVTYENRTAITPYFSRSDGRTRDWEEVWHSDPVPWLRGKPVPCDAGKTLWGHGVGMSASGALCMANEGQTWDQILTYFYTGIQLNPRWN